MLITDRAQNEILLLGPDRDDLVYRYRSRGQALGLETATVRLPRALRQSGPGDDLELSVRRSGNDLCIAVDRVDDCGYGFTVGDGWQLAALFLPAGYWGRGSAANAAACAAAAGALLLVPLIAPLRPTPVSQLACAGFGAALGMAARRQFALPGHSASGA